MRLSRLLMSAFIFTVLLSLSMNGPGQTELTIDMSNLGKAWQEYIANPDSENAQKVYAVLPDGSRDNEVRLQLEVRELINQNLHILERQIFSGERNSLRVAFRLFTISDNTLAEGLAKILGDLIRFDCKMFLQELTNHRQLVPDLGLIMCSFQLTLAEDSAGQELEKKTRLKALDYVEDEDLSDIKKECIKVLKKCKIK